MAQPTIWNRIVSFVTYAINNPLLPYNPADHDAEFDAAHQTVSEIRTNLGLIQRDDGLLLNGSVHPDALSSATRLIVAGWNIRGNWLTATSYAVKDFVGNGGLGYVCLIAHTSGTFAVDLAAGKWLQVDINAAAFSAPSGSSLIGTIAVGTGAVARTQQAKNRDVVSVKDFGAVGNGIADDTDAVQKAIVEAIADGFALYAPAGIYKLSTEMVGANPFTLFGDNCAPYLNNSTPTTRGGGTWFYIAHTGKGFNINSAGQFSSTNFKTFGTFRDQPAPAPGWAPTAHDFDIYLNNGDLNIRDLTLLNPTKGIYQTMTNNGRLWIDGLRGQPMGIGLDIDETMDVARVGNVHFWPYWANDSNVHFYTKANLIAARMARCDNPMVWNFFTIYPKYGFAFIGNAAGFTQRAQLGKIQIDNFGTTAINIAAGADGTSIEATGLLGYSGSGITQGIVCAANNCLIQASNIRMSLLGFCASSISGGTGNIALYTNWIVDGYNGANNNSPCFFTAAGNNTYVDGTLKATAINAAPIINSPSTGSVGKIMAQGSWSIVNPSTSTVVTHGLGYTPAAHQISIQPNSAPNSTLGLYVDTVTSTQFTVRGNPVGTVNGSWVIDGRAP